MNNNSTEKKIIYTHDEAALLVDSFEDILIKHGIKVPSPEDDERDPDDVGLYGSVYSDLLDGVEDRLYSFSKSLKECENTEIKRDVFSGTI